MYEKSEYLKLGAYCLQRMSHKGQKELLLLAEKNQSFTDLVISELREIENGDDFIK